jgi:hypothetical protein
MRTYSIFVEGKKRAWIKKQIELAKVCALEVALDKAEVIFASPESIQNLPRQAVLAIIPTQYELTLKERNQIMAVLEEKKLQIVITYLYKNLGHKLHVWFPPKSSVTCKDAPVAV